MPTYPEWHPLAQYRQCIRRSISIAVVSLACRDILGKPLKSGKIDFPRAQNQSSAFQYLVAISAFNPLHSSIPALRHSIPVESKDESFDVGPQAI